MSQNPARDIDRDTASGSEIEPAEDCAIEATGEANVNQDAHGEVLPQVVAHDQDEELAVQAQAIIQDIGITPSLRKRRFNVLVKPILDKAIDIDDDDAVDARLQLEHLYEIVDPHGLAWIPVSFMIEAYRQGSASKQQLHEMYNKQTEAMASNVLVQLNQNGSTEQTTVRANSPDIRAERDINASQVGQQNNNT